MDHLIFWSNGHDVAKCVSAPDCDYTQCKFLSLALHELACDEKQTNLGWWLSSELTNIDNDNTKPQLALNINVV